MENLSRAGNHFDGCYLRGSRLTGSFSDVVQSGVTCLCQGRRMQFRCVSVLRRRLTWVSQLTAGFHNKGTRRASVMKVRGGHRGPAQLGVFLVPLAAVAEWRIYLARATISRVLSPGFQTHRELLGCVQSRVSCLCQGAECSFGVCWCLGGGLPGFRNLRRASIIKVRDGRP